MRLFLVMFLSLCATYLYADTAIETETAQIGKQGDIGISQAIEYSHDKDGSFGYDTVTQFEYGITDKAEILIEPFFHTWDFPKDDANANGAGDLEITPSYMVVMEDTWVPAILIALKVKVPTGSTAVDSGGGYDYMPYLIFGQHIAGWTLNANLGVNYTTPADSGGFGSDLGSTDKTFTWALEAEREVKPELTLFYEVFSTEDNIFSGSTAAEYQFTKNFNAFLAVGYNREDSMTIRPGINLQF